MRVEMEIPHGFFETYGTGALVGALMNKAGPDRAFIELKEVHLYFHYSSQMWKEKNRGPHEFITTEHMPWCFLADILYLCEKGVRVTHETKIVDP